MKLINPTKIYKLMYQMFLDKGMNVDVACAVVDSLVETSIRGVDSHGIGLFPHYYTEVTLDRLNISPQIVIDKKANSVAVLDAKNTLGHYAGKIAMEDAINMAEDTGVGIVNVRNSTHFGAAWFFTNIAANQGMLGLAFTNTEALVNAYNGKDSFFGTNPFCFSSPMANEEPFCLDMATSTVSWNKIKNYRRQNLTLEEGWALDKNGIETVDPHKARSLTAIGGYKGFGLGAVIEILCSGLANGPLSKDIPPLYDLNIDTNRNISHTFIAIDIAKFLPLELFKSYMVNLALGVRSSEVTNQQAKVILPGDNEKRCSSLRSINGIPMDSYKFSEFLEISKDFQQALL